jgi:two-component system sensor histidine kinase UhpB
LSHARQLSLLRVIQEALANVYRHAKARNVTVTIHTVGSGFELTVSDDGCGMPIDQAKSDADALSRGVGIPAMKARLRRLGGVLEIRKPSEAGRTGTVLCGWFPRDTVIKKRGGRNKTGRRSIEAPSKESLGSALRNRQRREANCSRDDFKADR